MNKYEQIINYYRQQIVDKVLKPGDQLPNEIEIAQAFKVSRMTANKALNILAQEGCIRRVKGQGQLCRQPTDRQGDRKPDEFY